MRCNAELCNAMLCSTMLRHTRTLPACLPVAGAMPATNSYGPELTHERHMLSVPGKHGVYPPDSVIVECVRLQPSTFQCPFPVRGPVSQQTSQQTRKRLGQPKSAKRQSLQDPSLQIQRRYLADRPTHGIQKTSERQAVSTNLAGN